MTGSMEPLLQALAARGVQQHDDARAVAGGAVHLALRRRAAGPGPRAMTSGVIVEPVRRRRHRGDSGRRRCPIARRAFRQLWVGADVWALVFGGDVAASALSYVNQLPDRASRKQLAATTSGDAGSSILLGPVSAIDTVGGYTVYKCFVFLTTIGAFWATPRRDPAAAGRRGRGPVAAGARGRDAHRRARRPRRWLRSAPPSA